MVRIRMKRMGRKHRPFYRINAIEKRAPRDGRIIETLGWFNPGETEPERAMQLDVERIKHWISVGAVPSDSCMDIFAREGIVDAEQWKATRHKRVERKMKKIAEQKTAEQSAAEAAAKQAAEEEAAKKAEEEAKAKAEADAPAEAPAESGGEES